MQERILFFGAAAANVTLTLCVDWLKLAELDWPLDRGGWDWFSVQVGSDAASLLQHKQQHNEVQLAQNGTCHIMVKRMQVCNTEAGSADHRQAGRRQADRCQADHHQADHWPLCRHADRSLNLHPLPFTLL